MMCFCSYTCSGYIIDRTDNYKRKSIPNTYKGQEIMINKSNENIKCASVLFNTGMYLHKCASYDS